MEQRSDTRVLTLGLGDISFIEKLLVGAFEQVVNAPGSVTAGSQGQLQSICDATMDALRELSHIEASTSGVEDEQQLIEGQHGQESADAGVLDSTVVQLHQQVLAEVARVNSLRQEVPRAIATAIQLELEALRPTAGVLQELTEAGMAARAQAQPAEAAPMPEVEEARGMLSDAMNKLPGLRARLDQATSRLNRVISAFEMEQTRPSPRTVEKVLARSSFAAAAEDDTAGGADKEVAATRRRLATDLIAAATAIHS